MWCAPVGAPRADPATAGDQAQVRGLYLWCSREMIRACCLRKEKLWPRFPEDTTECEPEFFALQGLDPRRKSCRSVNRKLLLPTCAP
jgi:hypothetical protein